jgi:hypothetical protein
MIHKRMRNKKFYKNSKKEDQKLVHLLITLYYQKVKKDQDLQLQKDKMTIQVIDLLQHQIGILF